MSDLRSGGFSEYLSSGNDVLAGLTNLPKPAAEGSRSLTGIPGESRRATHLLLYPTLDQSRFIEIAHEDILGSQSLNAEESPFGAAAAVRLIVRQNATITSGLVAAKDGETGDDFDLDVRLGMAGNVEKRDEGDDGTDDDDCDGTDNGDCDGTDNGDCDGTDNGDCDGTDNGDCDGTDNGGCGTDVAGVCGGRTQAAEDTCVTCIKCRESVEICPTRATCTCESCETCDTCVTCNVECGPRPTLEGKNCETLSTRCRECDPGTRATCPPECHPD